MVGTPISDSQEEIDRLRKERQEEQKAGGLATEAGQAEQPAAKAPEPRIYVVQQGDSLSQIAKNLYGDASRWRKIYEANKDQIKDPKILRPGQELHIP
jgi:nucleoid-associated protein YgaU